MVHGMFLMNPSIKRKELLSELETAQALGITLSRLHNLLDEHVFNDGNPRPAVCSFQPSDLVLLEFWLCSKPNPKVVRMPRSAR